ncbi:MAG: SRPBCC domain-containing protein [Bacteroidales bacterium]|nr:SRPBCC domain-containing protein [Bacteroidales bacterium]
MELKKQTFITVQSIIRAPIDKVWKRWTSPDHITQWNNASDDWHTPSTRLNCNKADGRQSWIISKDTARKIKYPGHIDTTFRAGQRTGHTIR